MQPLLHGPRKDLTRSLVRDLLQSHRSIRIDYGATGLDADFAEVADITAYVGSGSQIASDATSVIHRTCTLNIDSDVTDTGWSYLSGFVRPYMTITDTETEESATFHLGVYTLPTPSRSLGPQPGTLAFQGYDLIYLLNQPVADSFEVAAGTDPAQAAADAIGLAIPGVTVIVTPSGITLPRSLAWPFDAAKPTTWLQIVQALLAAIGYREVWVDWDGVFRIQPFIDLQSEDPEWTFDMHDDDNIVAEDGAQDVDIYDVPNWWRFVMADLPDTPVEGVSQFTWTDTSHHNPGSTKNRGRLIRRIESVSVATYDALVTYAQRRIAATLSPAEVFAVKTQPFPLAWHLDVIHFFSDALETALPVEASGERRVVAVSWTLPLDGQSDMDWAWETITDQSAGLGLAIVETA